jgi:hypothetical protein
MGNTARTAKEARRAPRVPHDSVLELFDEEGRLTDDVLTLIDVSSVGVSFSTTRAFDKGAIVRGRLRLLGVGALNVMGRVVRLKKRSNSTLYAVAFDSVAPLLAGIESDD